MAVNDADQSNKAHRTRQSGAKSFKKKQNKKKKKQDDDDGLIDKPQNPRAFAFSSTNKAKRLKSRAVEKEQRRLHVPITDRSYGEPAPYVIVVQGPPQVGKSLLIKSLVKHYTKHNLPEVRGPITIVSGKQRRLQFVECPNDINGMIDAAKFADLALLLIDGVMVLKCLQLPIRMTVNDADQSNKAHRTRQSSAKSFQKKQNKKKKQDDDDGLIDKPQNPRASAFSSLLLLESSK